MASQWLVWREGKKAGPFSTEQLKRLGAAGKVLPTDHVQKEGHDQRYPATAVKGLFPEPIIAPVAEHSAAVPSVPRDKASEPESAPAAWEPDEPATASAGGAEAETVAGLARKILTIPWPRRRVGAAAIAAVMLLSLILFAKHRSRAVTNGADAVDLADAAAFSTGTSDPKTPDAPMLLKLVAAERDGLELPPLVTTRTAAAADTVALEYKTARAAYQDALKKAREQIRVQFRERKAQVGNEGGESRDYEAQAKAFAYGGIKMLDKGPLPTHPVMASAVAEYWQALETAARALGAVADKGLAAYRKAGVTDPAKLRPLEAASLAGRQARLLGVWASEPAGDGAFDAWVIDVDEATGGWWVNGTLAYKKGFTGYIFHAHDVSFADGKLSFEASRVDRETKKLGEPSFRASLRLQGGELIYEGEDLRGQPLTRTLAHTGEDAIQSDLEYWGVPKPVPGGSGGVKESQDPNDPLYVWRRIAVLSSFPSYRGKHGLGGGERFFLPSRSIHPTLTEGPYGPLTDMLLGRSPGGGRNQAGAEALFHEFDQLAESPYPYLNRAAGEFLALFRARFQLAEADELLGNTPNSSIREFQQKVMMPSAKFVFQREVDRSDLQRRLDREFPGKYEVIDAPMSEASRQHLHDLFSNTGGLMDEVKKRAFVSGLLAYADMAQVDRQAALWRTWLVPLAKKCAGPTAKTPFLSFDAEYNSLLSDRGKRLNKLKYFRVKNVSGQDLTHVVVELVAENEWGDKAAHYYYFPQLDVVEVARLVPHPRWDRRRLVYSNTIKLTWTLWSDQGTEVHGHAELKNPQPNADSSTWRKNYLENDDRYQPEGEALGAVVRNFPFLPIVPERQRSRLLFLATAGRTYAVQIPGEQNALGVRFKSASAGAATVELEVFDLASRRPYRRDTPVWKGKLQADSDSGFVIRLDAGWTIQLSNDDEPSVVVSADSGESKPAPMVRVRLP